MPPRKPVLFIPGFPGSELRYTPENRVIFPPSLGDLADPARKGRLLDLITSNDPNVVPGEPIRDILGIFLQAGSLYNVLENHLGYDVSGHSAEFKHLGWDWRKGVDDPSTVNGVITAIDTLF